MFELTNDQERQEDEILVLSSICNSNEFSYKKGNTIRCVCNVFTNNGPFELKNAYKTNQKESSDSSHQKYLVEHLPPVRLHLELPNDYPSRRAPNFVLVISWLAPWETSFICQKLDEIWQDNKGNEVLFLWLEFLRNDLFSFLGITNTLDISPLYMIYNAPKVYLMSNLASLGDKRAQNRALFLNPIQFLINYSRHQHKVEFEKGFYNCIVCFEMYSGHKCIELENCKHVFCRECMQQYATAKINEGSLKTIVCPDVNCSSEITINEIKDLCPNLFSKYEELMLRMTLSTMNDIVFCPRTECQHPVIREMDDTLATCSKCRYSFCSYCYKVYHGAAPCEMTSTDTMKLINSYENASKTDKKLLEKKYGRKQIQTIVEKHLTKEYLKDNAKPCPNCQTFITKIDGCNKMICVYCQVSFCWLCGMHIKMENAYDHFTINNNTCYGRLFEGIVDIDFDDIDLLQ